MFIDDSEWSNWRNTRGRRGFLKDPFVMSFHIRPTHDVTSSQNTRGGHFLDFLGGYKPAPDVNIRHDAFERLMRLKSPTVHILILSKDDNAICNNLMASLHTCSLNCCNSVLVKSPRTIATPPRCTDVVPFSIVRWNVSRAGRQKKRQDRQLRERNTWYRLQAKIFKQHCQGTKSLLSNYVSIPANNN